MHAKRLTCALPSVFSVSNLVAASGCGYFECDVVYATENKSDVRACYNNIDVVVAARHLASEHRKEEAVLYYGFSYAGCQGILTKLDSKAKLPRGVNARFKLLANGMYEADSLGADDRVTVRFRECKRTGGPKCHP